MSRLSTTALRRSEILAHAAALGWPAAICNGVAMAGERAWRARIAEAFDLEIAAVAAQLAVAEAAARHLAPDTGAGELPMLTEEEDARVVAERERRTARAGAARAAPVRPADEAARARGDRVTSSDLLAAARLCAWPRRTLAGREVARGQADWRASIGRMSPGSAPGRSAASPTASCWSCRRPAGRACATF
jgi:hypothetical protein